MTKEQERAKKALELLNKPQPTVPIEPPSSINVRTPLPPKGMIKDKEANTSHRSNNEQTKWTAAKIAGQMGLDVFKIFDPTGVSSYGDVYDAYNQFDRDKSWMNFGNLMGEGIGALPLLGKVTVPLNLIKFGRNIKKAHKALNQLNRVADVLDAPSRLIAPKLTNAIERVTMPLSGSRFLLNYAPDGINAAIKTTNILNTTNDIINLGEDINDIIKTNKNGK